MLIWLYFYTAANEEDGLRMAALLVSSQFESSSSSSEQQDGGMDSANTMPVDDAMTFQIPVEEPEF
jgi:hypothetical protein